MRPIFPALSALALATAPAAAQTVDPRPGLLDVISVDRIAQNLVNLGLATLRNNVMEVQYDHMSIDVVGARVTLSGLSLRPTLVWDRAAQCEITAERATIDMSDLASDPTIGSGSLDMVGLSVSSACLDPDSAEVARALGLRVIEIDHGRLSGHYDNRTGAISAQLSLSVNGFMALDMIGTATVVPKFDLVYGGSFQEPGLRVSEALLTIHDDGGWEKIEALLPSEFRDPETIRLVGTEVLTDILGDGAPLGGTGRNFVDNAMDHVVAFVTEPGDITIEADLPPEGVQFNLFEMRTPMDLVRALALEVRAVPSSRSGLIPAADLLAALNGGADLPVEDRLILARALLTGDGVPRSPSLGYAVLEPMVIREEVSGEAALLAAAALVETAPANAYDLALTAAARGTPGATAMLDRIEELMTTLEVLELQESNRIARGLTDPDELFVAEIGESRDPRDLRSRAIARLTGTGAARDYALAYYLAILAEAAGDVAATSVIADINARFTNRGELVTADWSRTKREIEEAAVEVWVDLNLAGRFGAN